MIEFYPQIKAAHVGLVYASGGLFLIRGLLLFAGQRWVKATPINVVSYTIDSALLTAALMLLTALKLNPFAVGWLATKMGLLVVYIGLGIAAFRPTLDLRWRLGCFAAALLTYGYMITVARAHHPLGWFA